MLRVLIVITFLFSSINGQGNVTPPTVTPDLTQQKPLDASKMKSMEEALKGKKEIPGLFKLYQDEKDGKLFMLIGSDQLNKEYIHFVHGLNGQINAGVIKGGYRGSRIFTLKRYFNRVEFEVQNTAFYYDPQNPLSRSSGSNISTAILASSIIISEKEGQVLIAVDDIFLTEALHQITRGLFLEV